MRSLALFLGLAHRALNMDCLCERLRSLERLLAPERVAVRD